MKLVSLSPQALSRQLTSCNSSFFSSSSASLSLSLSLSSSFSCLYFFFSEQRRSSPGRGDDFQRNRPWNEEERAAAVEFICRRKKGSFESRTARFVRSILITALRPILCAFRRGAHALSPPEQPQKCACAQPCSFSCACALAPCPPFPGNRCSRRRRGFNEPRRRNHRSDFDEEYRNKY